MPQPKILVFDIETAPDLADVWGFWKNNVGMNQVRRDGWMMAFSAKWLGSKEIIYAENRTQNDKPLIKELLKLIEEADIVIAHNGKQFDMGWFRAKAAIYGLKPPSPVKIIDTLIESKKLFKFPSFKLEYLTRRFGVQQKYPHKNFPGHELWVECMKGNPKAWKEMQNYNTVDTIALEEYYLKIRPWIAGHPNLGVYTEGDEPCCPKCGGEDLTKRGFSYTNLGKYQRYRCNEDGCGGWSRGRFNLFDKKNYKSLVTNEQ